MAEVMVTSTRMRWSALYLCVLAPTFLSACHGPPLDHREQELVQLYLICYDCGSPLDSVRAFAQRNPIAVVDTLNGALVDGPAASPARDSAFVLAFVGDSTYRVVHRRPPLQTNRADYLLEHQRRYDQGYQSRAAIGLGWIHDARAVTALRAALTSRLPVSVRQAIRFALDSLP
jgi:hypothetical protein